MLSSVSKGFSSLLSFFRPTMDNQVDLNLLLCPVSPLNTSIFLFLMKSLASGCSDSNSIINNYRVECIIHSKNTHAPEHEYLVIETKDDADNRFHFILERNVSEEITSSVSAEDTHRLQQSFDIFKRFLRTAMGSSELASLEEGTGQISDAFSVLSVESTDMMLDSLGKSGNRAAVDQFVGGDIFVKKYLGRVVQYFKPKRLTLFELAVIAETVHLANPSYSLLKKQCYYYAALVYAVAELHAGVQLIESADKSQSDYVQIRGSPRLSNRYGRWNDVKVTNVDPNSLVVHAIFARVAKKIASLKDEVNFQY